MIVQIMQSSQALRHASRIPLRFQSACPPSLATMSAAAKRKTFTVSASSNFDDFRALQESGRLNNEARALSAQGEHEKAEKMMQEALSITLRVAGGNNLSAALGYQNLGEIQYKRGNYDDAEKNFRKALRLREDAENNPMDGGNVSFDISVSRESIAQVYEARGKLDEAKSFRDGVRPNHVCAWEKVRTVSLLQSSKDV